MELISYFDRKSLNLVKKYIKTITSNNLNHIELAIFCGCIIKGLFLNKIINDQTEKEKIIRAICQIFYAIDVDFRCVISWQDFTAFCLRLIRNKFRPIARNCSVKYSQCSHEGIQFNAYQMYYSDITQLLYVFDRDNPNIRIIRKSLFYDGNKFNPIEAIIKHIKLYNAGLNINFQTVEKSYVCCMEYVKKIKCMIICTSDSIMSYWDVDLTRFIGYERLEKHQVGILFCNNTGMLVTWGATDNDYNFSVINPIQRQIKYKVLFYHMNIINNVI